MWLTGVAQSTKVQYCRPTIRCVYFVIMRGFLNFGSYISGGNNEQEQQIK